MSPERVISTTQGARGPHAFVNANILSQDFRRHLHGSAPLQGRCLCRRIGRDVDSGRSGESRRRRGLPIQFFSGTIRRASGRVRHARSDSRMVPGLWLRVTGRRCRSAREF